MKITGLRSVVIYVPQLKKKMTDIRSRLMTAVLVEIVTDEGIKGIGEAPDVIGGEITKGIIDSTTPLILGEDPFNIEVIMKRIYGQYNLTHLSMQAANWALIGVEMALWDIIGKACDKPLHKLWGGAFRREIPFFGSVSRTNAKDMAEQAESLVKRGFKTLYAKVGFKTLEDLECVRIMKTLQGMIVTYRSEWMPTNLGCLEKP